MQDETPEDEREESQSESSDDGDALDVSGIEIEVGNTDGGDSKGIEEPQRLVLDDSLTGELEHIVASDIFNDKSAQQDECLEIGWQRDAYDSDEKLTAHAEGEYHVNLGEFLNDVEDDPDAATMLGTANIFNLDAEGLSAEDPSQSADLAPSQAGDSIFDKSAGPGDCSFFGEEVPAGELLAHPQTDMPSSFLRYFYADDVSFNAWQVLALLCLVLLMFVGGIIVIDAISQIL